MKIKSLGHLSFLLSFDNVDVVTDPFSLDDVGLKFPKTKADVVLYTDDANQEDIKMLDSKLSASKKEDLIHIHTPGEYELGGLMVRRDLHTNFYILDEDYLRVLYIGCLSKDAKVDDFKNLGDVEVLIIPVGDGENFPEFSVIEKIINVVEPLLLIPSGFKTPAMKKGDGLKSIDDFVKQAGYTNVEYEKTKSIKGAPEKEVRNMDVVVLQ